MSHKVLQREPNSRVQCFRWLVVNCPSVEIMGVNDVCSLHAIGMMCAEKGDPLVDDVLCMHAYLIMRDVYGGPSARLAVYKWVRALLCSRLLTIL